jgi:hypothetical protein
MSTSDHGSRWTVDASAAKPSLDRRSLARALDVATMTLRSPDSAPTRASRAPDVATEQREMLTRTSPRARVLVLDFQRPGSSPPSTLSVGYAAASFGFPPETSVFDDEMREPPSAETECPTSSTSVGLPSPALPPRSGSRRSDCRGSFDCFETTSSRGRCHKNGDDIDGSHATGDLRATGPEGPATRWPVWFADRVARRGSRRSGPRPCFHGCSAPGMLTALRWRPDIVRPFT